MLSVILDLLESSSALYCSLALIGIAILFVLMRKLLRKIFRPVRQSQAQIIKMDRDNAEALRNFKSIPEQNGSGLNTSMGRSIIDDTFVTFLLTGKKQKRITLKMPSDQAGSLREGTTGRLTWQGKDVIRFENV